MALRPGLRIIDPTSMPIDKMPIERLKEVMRDTTPMGMMLDLLPDTSLQAESAPDSPNDGLEQIIDLIGIPNPGDPEFF